MIILKFHTKFNLLGSQSENIKNQAGNLG